LIDEKLVIKPDEFDDPDKRNYSIATNKGSFTLVTKLVRFANLGSVNIELTPEFKSLNDLGKLIVKKLIELSNEGVDYLEVTQRSITVRKESAIKWRHLQPSLMNALQFVFESKPNAVQVEDRTGKFSEFGVLSEYIQ